jgi:hypothetical protein
VKTTLVLGGGATRAAGADAKPAPLDADFFAIGRDERPRETKMLEDHLAGLLGGFGSSLTDSLESTTNSLFLKAFDGALD